MTLRLESLLQSLNQVFLGTNALKLTQVTKMMLFEQLVYLWMVVHLAHWKIHFGIVFHWLHSSWPVFTEVFLR